MLPPSFLASGTKYVISTICCVPIVSAIRYNFLFNSAITSSLNTCFASVCLTVSLIAASCPVSAAKAKTVLPWHKVTYEGASLKLDAAD